MTPAQQARHLARERERWLRAQAKARLRELRAQLAMARAAHKGRVAEVRSACRADRVAVKARARSMRELARVELQARIRDEHAGAVQACMIRHEQARAAVRNPREAVRAERAYQAELRRIERLYIQKQRETRRASRAERRSESDDAVRVNLDPQYVALWDRVKGSIRGTDRRSRTEAFMQYVEEHPGEVLEVLEDRTDALVRDLERQEREHRALARATRRRPTRAASGGDVPF